MRLAVLVIAMFAGHRGYGQNPTPTATTQHLKTGPFETLILSSAFLFDGSGDGVRGPVDIVISGSRIAEIAPSHVAAVRPAGSTIIDMHGRYVLPGLIDCHVHIGLSPGPFEYKCALLLAHGITSVREVSPAFFLDDLRLLREKSKSNTAVAPRIFLYPSCSGAEASRLLDLGADGLKTYASDEPAGDLVKLFQVAQVRGARVACHDGGSLDALELAVMGMTSLEHFFGLPEAAGGFRPGYAEDFRSYHTRADIFRRCGKLWRAAVESRQSRMPALIQALLERDVTLVPTFAVYEALRDPRAARSAAWHADFTHPELWRAFESGVDGSFSFWGSWTADDEAEWRETFRLWMRFVRDYAAAGGRIAAGADSGFMYDIHGFGLIRELQLLREAGLTALEVLTAATRVGAELLGRESDLGTVEVGKLADLVVCRENPLADFGLLFASIPGTHPAPQGLRPSTIEMVMKDGILYDAEELRSAVRNAVKAAVR